MLEKKKKKKKTGAMILLKHLSPDAFFSSPAKFKTTFFASQFFGLLCGDKNNCPLVTSFIAATSDFQGLSGSSKGVLGP